MKAVPPVVEKREDGWYIVIVRLGSKYTYGPLPECPQAEMEITPITKGTFDAFYK